jgi:hypothetical protein
MKKLFLTLNGLVSVSLIVLLLGVSVNRQVDGKFAPHATQVADGVPLPPPVNPPPKLDSDQIADGVPLPPPVNPPPKWNDQQVADGVPLPPPVNPPPKLNRG